MKTQPIVTWTLLFGLVVFASACRERAAEEVKEAIEVHQQNLEDAQPSEGPEEAQAPERADVDTNIPTVFDEKPAVGTEARCPVMKDVFTVKEDSPTATYKGKTYVFCCPGCKPQFEQNPEKYLE